MGATSSDNAAMIAVAKIIDAWVDDITARPEPGGAVTITDRGRLEDIERVVRSWERGL